MNKKVNAMKESQKIKTIQTKTFKEMKGFHFNKKTVEDFLIYFDIPFSCFITMISGKFRKEN